MVSAGKIHSTAFGRALGYTALYLERHVPAGISCQNDVVSTSMRRDHVASTSTQRHFATKYPLGWVLRIAVIGISFDTWSHSLTSLWGRMAHAF